MRGITPIIAIILLLMITIALVGFAYMFFSGTMESATQAGTAQIEQQINIMGEKFSVDFIDKNTVIIRNTGTTELKNMKFYVDGKEADIMQGPSSVPSGHLGTFTLNLSENTAPSILKISSLGTSKEEIISGKLYNPCDDEKNGFSPKILWDRLSSIDADDSGYIAVDSGNNYILFTYPQNSPIIMKYGKNGSILWNKTFNGSIGYYAGGLAVDSEDNAIATGYGKFGLYYTAKYNPEGVFLWNATYNGGGCDYSGGQDIGIDSDNNIIIVGRNCIEPEFFTIKYNKNGQEIWRRSYDSSSTDFALGVGVDSDNNIIATGSTNNGVTYDYYTIKYDKNGNAMWNRTYDSGGTDRDGRIAVDSGNNVIVTGNGATIKYDSSGNLI
ncbi:hypothetical protein J4447_02190, partial [Candidatus Pacearchaeota archaeon]|nr:hypothetical protein [Candidatus Pacearchaeota archaeon]